MIRFQLGRPTLAVAVFVSALVASWTFPIAPRASDATHGSKGASPYVGEQLRAIAALSADDVDALLNGHGWGFAKPAELNGYPGPLHVLELAGELKLTPAQKMRVEQVRQTMLQQAKVLGRAFVDSERALSRLFAEGKASLQAISSQIAKSAELRGQLRATHLAAHVAIYPVLTSEQRTQYDVLRGYTGTSAHRAGQHEHGRGKHHHQLN